MGDVLSIIQIQEQKNDISRLLLYSQKIKEIYEAKSVGKEIADELLNINENKRSMRLEKVFNDVLDKYPDGVTIKDIDVLFNPSYQVDVLRILIDARKRKKYNLIWPGRIENGKLIYAEEGYPDYKVYEIANYDITCVR